MSDDLTNDSKHAVNRRYGELFSRVQNMRRHQMEFEAHGQREALLLMREGEAEVDQFLRAHGDTLHADTMPEFYSNGKYIGP